MPAYKGTDLDVAVAAVTAAARLCRAVRSEMAGGGDGAPWRALTKEDLSPVTLADLGSQALISASLARARPGDPVLGEEDAAPLRRARGGALERLTELARAEERDLDGAAILAAIDRCAHGAGANALGGRYWVLDPIDGTRGFLRPGGQYAIALALLEDHRPVLGALACPDLPHPALPATGAAPAAVGTLVTALAGGGAHQRPLFEAAGDPRPIRADDITDPARAVLCEPVERRHSAHEETAALSRRLGLEIPPLRMDSQAKYAAVARGDASLYLRLPTRADYREKVWDHAAGALVLTEAGGRVTDLDGLPLDFSTPPTLARNRGVLASNDHLHGALLAALAGG